MLKMLPGFNNVLESEAIPNVLPKDQNNPQKVPHGLYTEQLSGTSFTRPRAHNRSVWLYRVIASSSRSAGFEPYEAPSARDALTLQVDPNPGRWRPMNEPMVKQDFIDGLRLFGQAGDPKMYEGLSIYLYTANHNMDSRSMSFHDGELLVVPQRGSLEVRTEMGHFSVDPKMICVIPRGIKFSIDLVSPSSSESHRGYAVEVFNEGGFRLPELGLIGANGLANPLHFEHPQASFETREYSSWSNIIKVGGQWFQQTGLKHSPYDVVAWRGNYLPYRYDLRRYVAMNSVTVDHPDPSIFTVLTVPTSVPGVAACDFVIFPPRWMVAQHTFRPPYFHRNVMSEFMGLVRGQYDGKKVGFLPGGVSLHNRLTPHGPDAPTFEGASNAHLEPTYYDSGLAFMFETAYLIQTTSWAREGEHREHDYADCWKGLKRASL